MNSGMKKKSEEIINEDLEESRRKDGALWYTTSDRKFAGESVVDFYMLSTIAEEGIYRVQKRSFDSNELKLVVVGDGSLSQRLCQSQ